MSASTPLCRTALSHVALRTSDIDGMRRFYERVVGLSNQPAPSGVGARLGWGSGHHVLDLLMGSDGLAHFGLEVLDAGGPEAIAERMAARGYAVSKMAELAGGICVHDPDGNVIQLHGPISRAGEHTADSGRRPIRVQHITLATGDVPGMVAFYVELGFKVSDHMGGRFTWLRSGVDHHVVAVVKAEAGRGLDHYSYDLGGWLDFKIWCDRLTELGIPVRWGPGRHGPGNNLFIFFDDPAGNHVELSAEMERYWDDRASYPARAWQEAASTVNLWGGQVPNWRTTD